MRVKPNLSGQECPMVTHKTYSQVKAALEKDKNESELSFINAPDLADSVAWKNYIQDPFNTSNEMAMRDLLGGKDLNDSNKGKVFPPYINRMSTLSDTATTFTSLNTSKANKYFLFPKIFQLLYAEFKNKQIGQLCDDLECQELINLGQLYIQTMPLNDTQMKMHGGLKYWHSSSMGEHVDFKADQDNHLLLMSASFFTILFDIALDCPKEHAPKTSTQGIIGLGTREARVASVRAKLSELMAALDKMSQQITNIGDLIFDTSEDNTRWYCGFCVNVTPFPSSNLNFFLSIAIMFFILRSLPGNYRNMSSIGTDNEGNEIKCRTNQSLIESIILRCLGYDVIHILSQCGVNPNFDDDNIEEWNSLLLKLFDVIQINRNKKEVVEWSDNNNLTVEALSKNLPRGLKSFFSNKMLTLKGRGISSFTYLLWLLKNNLASQKGKQKSPWPLKGGSIWQNNEDDAGRILVGVGTTASAEKVVSVRPVKHFSDLSPIQERYKDCHQYTTLMSLIGITVKIAEPLSPALQDAVDIYQNYVEDVNFADRKLLLDVDVKEKKQKKTTDEELGGPAKPPPSYGIMVQEARGDVTRLLGILNGPVDESSRVETEQITLDLVQSLTQTKFKSISEAHTSLSTNLKLQGKFRPDSFYQVITQIILASNEKIRVVTVTKPKVKMCLDFPGITVKIKKFEDDEQCHYKQRIMISIPAAEFKVMWKAVFTKKGNMKQSDVWVKRLVEFFKTIEGNDAWVSTLGNYRESLDKVSANEMVFVAQKEYMTLQLGLADYKSYSETNK